MSKNKRIRRILIWFLVAIATLTTFTTSLFIFKTDIFVREFQPILKSFISQAFNVDIKYQNIKGNIVSGFEIDNVSIFQSSDLMFNAKSIYLDPTILPLINGEFNFRNINIKNSNLFVESYSKMTNDVKNSLTKKIKPRLLVENFNIDSLKLNLKNNESICITADFSLEISDDISISVQQGDFNLFNDYSFKFVESKLLYSDNLLNIENTKLKMPTFEVKLNHFVADLSSNNINRLHFNLENYQDASNNISINELKFNYNENNLDLTSVIEMNKMYNYIQCNGEIDKIKIDRLNQNIFENLKFNIQNGEFNMQSNSVSFIDSLYAKFEISKNVNEELILKPQLFRIDNQEVEILGKLKINKNKQLTANDLKLLYKNTLTNISNFTALDLNNFNVKGKINSENLKVLNKNLIPIELVVNGLTNFETTMRNGEFSLNAELDYYNGKLFSSVYDSLKAKVYWQYLNEKNHVTIDAKMQEFIFNKLIFEQINLDVWTEQYNNIFTKIVANSAKQDSILITGEYVEDKIFVNDYYAYINNIRLDGNKMVLNLEKSKIDLEDTHINIGNGHIKLSGEYFNDDKYKFHGETHNLNLKDVSSIFGKTHRLGAICDSDIYLSKWESSPIVLLNASCFDGYFDDISFSKLSSQLTFQNKRLSLSNLNFVTELGEVKFQGWANYNLQKGFAQDDSLYFSGNFDKFELLSLNRYFPWQQESKGLLSGDFKIYNKVDQPQIQMNLIVNNPVFDKITGNQLTGSLVYSNKRLYFKNLNFKTNDGEYSGVGSLPVNLDIIKDNVNNLYNNPIDFMFTGISTNLEFLPPYIQNIDSLSGDFSMQLNLTGTLKNPIREGQVIVRDGEIHLIQLDNPITSINAIAMIANNKLVIDNFEGKMNKPNLKSNFIINALNDLKLLFLDTQKEKEELANISMTGAMDLNSFFKPDYLLHLTGNEVYVNSSYGQFYGTGNADFWMTGKDTIKISGEFVPNAHEFTLYGFTSEEDYFESNISNANFTEYDITIPLYNEVKVTTDNLNILVDGELNLSSTGGDEFDYSGTINIIDGKFDFNGNVFENTEGTFYLNPGNESPFVDVKASLLLIDEDINIAFVGPMSNPNIILESASATYSQSDILKMIAFSTISDEDNVTIRVGDLVSNYVENEIEKNIQQYGILDEFKVQNKNGTLNSNQNNSDVNVYFGKQISKNLYLNTSINFSETLLNEYEIAYRVNRNMSIVARVDEENNWHFNYRFKYHY